MVNNARDLDAPENEETFAQTLQNVSKRFEKYTKIAERFENHEKWEKCLELFPTVVCIIWCIAMVAVGAEVCKATTVISK